MNALRPIAARGGGRRGRRRSAALVPLATRRPTRSGRRRPTGVADGHPRRRRRPSPTAPRRPLGRRHARHPRHRGFVDPGTYDRSVRPATRRSRSIPDGSSTTARRTASVAAASTSDLPGWVDLEFGLPRIDVTMIRVDNVDRLRPARARSIDPPAGLAAAIASRPDRDGRRPTKPVDRGRPGRRLSSTSRRMRGHRVRRRSRACRSRSELRAEHREPAHRRHGSAATRSSSRCAQSDGSL